MLNLTPRTWLHSLLLGVVLASPAIVAAEERDDESWDTRLNGIWKVASVVMDGERVKDDTDCKYAICDGVVVSASPRSARFMPRSGEAHPFGKPQEVPFGQPAGGDSALPSRNVEPPEVKAEEPPEQTIVELTIERAKLKKMDPYPWIDLKVVSGDSYEEWPGIYHIEGNQLTLAFATTRPTKLVSPKVNMEGLFTRPSATSRMITLVRESGK
jgi:hypothetical protein